MLHGALGPPQPIPLPLFQPFTTAEENAPPGLFNADESWRSLPKGSWVASQ
jgi:hypothetical protein